MNIAIVGGGIAGSAAALFLKKQGHDVTVFERETAPKPLGAGIMLQITGKKVLEELGMGEAVITHSRPIQEFIGVHPDMKPVINFKLDEFGEEYQGRGVQRGFLFYALFQQLAKNGINIVSGENINGFSFEKGKTIMVGDLNRYDKFDLIVVANGARSKLRDQFGVCIKSKRQNLSALWAKVPLTVPSLENKIFQVYDKRSLLGFMPIGTDPFTEDPTELVNIFWGINGKTTEILEPQGFSDWKKYLNRTLPQFKELFDHIATPDDLTFAPYFDSRMSQMYYKNIAFIGDVAHALSPQLSSGTNLALLDAKVLAESIAAYPLEKALQTFSDQRLTQVQYYYWMSKLVTPIYQSSQPLSFIRDYVLPTGFKIKPFNKFVNHTICGLKGGLFSKLPSKYYT